MPLKRQSNHEQQKRPTQRQKSERARRKAMGIALIQRPLKFIKARTNEHHQEFKDARMAADFGRGEIVQRIARSFL
jgi:hypothetical protein